jgi:MoaA/NifB/PqqE/SkfB family radical SAM enzyme
MSKMNLIEKLNQEMVIKSLSGISSWESGSKSPLVVELDPTTACDLACPGCISGELLNQEKFSNERLLKLGVELYDAGVKAVILIGGGEPLAHPAIGELITYFGLNDIQVGITTNGSFIDRYLDSIAQYVNWTRVSMDAGTDDTFRKLRPTRNNESKFNKIISNIELLAKNKKKANALGYSFLIRSQADGRSYNPAGKNIGLVETENIDEIYIAAQLAKSIGCDYFEPKPSYDNGHSLIMHKKEDMLRAQEQIEKAKTLEDENFKILESVNLKDSLDSISSVQPKSYIKCPTAELRTLITPSGAYICPYFRGAQSKNIGDLHGQSFKEMWVGQQRREVMNLHNSSKDCKMHCIRHETNNQLFKIHQDIHKGVEINLNNFENEDRFI